MMKKITQNSNRYSKVGSNWKISASTKIPPIFLPIGVELKNLKPIIKSNGIVIKVGDNYLCSLVTLNTIKDSNNPHYDIVENGKVKVKDKQVIVGKTIKIIELDITQLNKLSEGREFMNRQSGVVSVEYTNAETTLIEGIPKKLIEQINYTLDRDSTRPSDKFEVVDYFKMVDKINNPAAVHYTILPIRTITDQQETIFDPAKLRVFITELSNQLTLLKKDFNTIQDTFFRGLIPNPNTYGVIIEDKIARTDVDDEETNHSNKTTLSSELISIEISPVQSIKSELETAKIELQEEIKNIKSE